jgi:hypothetical protein
MKDLIVIIISALAGISLFALIMCFLQLTIWAAEYLLLINNSTHKWVRQYNAMNGKWYWAQVERSTTQSV